MATAAEIEIRRPDDFHVHLRQGEPLAAYVREAARLFARVLVMPNTLPPITTPRALAEYRATIMEAAGGPGGPAANATTESGGGFALPNSRRTFTPLMTFKIQTGMSAADVRALASAGAVAGKYYPRGVTTNSADGVEELEAVAEPLGAMEELDLVLCIHGEEPGAPVLERERAFLPRVAAAARRYPRLRIVLEHVSSRAGVEAVLASPARVAATITVHHLLYTIDDLLGEGLAPHLYCKPVLKGDGDRAAIRRVVLEGNPRFFFGSDSAPHAREAKECACGAAGVYSMPTALPLLAAFFEHHGALGLLEDFTSRFGAEFYRLPLNEGRLTLVRERWRAPQITDGVVPLGGGGELEWRCV